MSNETEKYKILEQLHQGVSPQLIAEDLSVSYSKVLRFRREYEEAKLNDTLGELMKVDPALILEVGANLVGADEAVQELAKGVTALQALEQDFVDTAKFLSNRIRVSAGTIDHPSELVDLTDSLCKLNDSFFNKKTTQVNVQNNYGEGGAPSAYGAFLGDAPGGTEGQS